MVKYRNCMKTNETTISKNIIHKGKVINFGVDEIISLGDMIGLGPNGDNVITSLTGISKG